MAMLFMPKRSAYILLLILGVIVLVGGIAKKTVKETLVGAAILIYAIVSLLTSKKKP